MDHFCLISETDLGKGKKKKYIHIFLKPLLMQDYLPFYAIEYFIQFSLTWVVKLPIIPLGGYAIVLTILS